MSYIVIWNRYRSLIGLSRNSIIKLLLLSLIATTSEAVGIGIFYPIFQYFQADSDITLLRESSRLWVYLSNFYSSIGMQLSVYVLLYSAFLLFLVRQLFLFIKIVYLARIRYYLVMQLRNKLFQKFLQTNSDNQDNILSGNLVNIIMQESSAAVSGVLAPVNFIVYSITLVVYFSMLLYISWTMTIVSAIVFILVARIPKKWISLSKANSKDIVVANNSISTLLFDRIKSPRLVRLSGMGSVELNEFKKMTEIQKGNLVKKTVLLAKTDMTIEPAVLLFGSTFLYFSYGVLNIPLELLGVFIIILMRLLPVVKAIILQVQAIKGSLGQLEAVQDRIINMDKYREVDNGNIDTIGLFNGINFRSVSYKYPSATTKALSGLNINIPRGSFTAIIGPSGSGKSTFIDLLPRLRSVTTGQILIDDHLIDSYTLKGLRDAIAYVPQFPQVFSSTIKEHIGYGKKNATIEEIKIASRLSGSESFIEALPNGYDTLLGEGGVKISGGQRQRIDLARALIRKAPLLILDEPTSNLDSESENDFLDALRRIHKDTNTTIIMVAHRLISIEKADQIIILKHGRITAIGDHKKLMSSSNWYAKVWKLQTESGIID